MNGLDKYTNSVEFLYFIQLDMYLIELNIYLIELDIYLIELNKEIKHTFYTYIREFIYLYRQVF